MTVRGRELDKNVWGAGRREGRGVGDERWVRNVKRRRPRSRREGCVAVQVDSWVKWMTEVTCCSSSCKQNQSHWRKRRSTHPRSLSCGVLGVFIFHQRTAHMFSEVVAGEVQLSCHLPATLSGWRTWLGTFVTGHSYSAAPTTSHNTSMRNWTALKWLSLTSFLLWERISSARFEVLMEQFPGSTQAVKTQLNAWMLL